MGPDNSASVSKKDTKAGQSPPQCIKQGQHLVVLVPGKEKQNKKTEKQHNSTKTTKTEQKKTKPNHNHTQTQHKKSSPASTDVYVQTPHAPFARERKSSAGEYGSVYLAVGPMKHHPGGIFWWPGLLLVALLSHFFFWGETSPQAREYNESRETIRYQGSISCTT